MLRNLKIQDLILVESLEVPFEPGFNVLSGETGSGKSALMTALSLILGKRADSQVVRKGMTKARIEGVFDTSPILNEILENAGIEVDDDIIIRREITAAGKSRAYVNDQSVTLNFLKELAPHLVKFVGQHANQQLMSHDAHRDLLDQYGECDISPFSVAYQELCELERRLLELQQDQKTIQRKIEIRREEIEEIETVNPKIHEDEELYSEYSILTHAEEFQEKCHAITESLSGDESILTHLNELKHPFQEVTKIDPKFQEQLNAFQQSIIELQEISHFLDQAKSSHEYCPTRLTQVNERMSVLHTLKRKYGTTIAEVLEHCQKRKEELDRLENCDGDIESIEKQIAEKKKACDQFANVLSTQRKTASERLEKALLTHLKDLNMPKAKFRVALTRVTRTAFGDEKIMFFLRPNQGENEVSVTDCASGGELSRLMLSFQVLLAGKEKIPTIVFDEVDANIGGNTAVAVGKKLREIGNEHQVLCITHFPQVASQADFHWQISKEETEGRTVTFVQSLGDKEKEKELQRMRGITTSATLAHS